MQFAMDILNIKIINYINIKNKYSIHCLHSGFNKEWFILYIKWTHYVWLV